MHSFNQGYRILEYQGCMLFKFLIFFLFFRLIEIPFGEKDQRGECTLLQGDSVEFQIATDRRDKLQRATNIALLETTFSYSGEIRETVSF